MLAGEDEERYLPDGAGCRLEALAWLGAVLALCSLPERLFLLPGKVSHLLHLCCLQWVPESTRLELLCVILGVQLNVLALLGAQPGGHESCCSPAATAWLCRVVCALGALAWQLGARDTLPPPRVAISSSFHSQLLLAVWSPAWFRGCRLL